MIDKVVTEINVEALGSSWNDLRKELFTTEEILECNLRVDLITEVITARKEKGVSQRQLEEISGVKQPVIARIEKGTSTPNIETLIKMLAPLGKTLKVVSIE